MSATGRTVRVAYQGAPGAFSVQAIEQRWSGRARTVAARTFDDVLTLVSGGQAHFGVMPVWNSTMGEVAVVRDALQSHASRELVDAVRVIDEFLVPVRHHLVAVPRVTLAHLRHVTAHPAALAQCRRFLAAHTWLNAVPAWDSAGAARELAQAARGATDQGPMVPGGHWFAPSPGLSAGTTGVIASRAAAERYGLVILVEDVHDHADNATRFAVIARSGDAGSRPARAAGGRGTRRW